MNLLTGETLVPGESWRPVSVVGKEFLSARYSVSSSGRIRNEESGLILRCYQNTAGYWFYRLSFEGKSHGLFAHRLVAMAFHENPESKKEVNHRDGNKANNRADNLQWSTPSENKFHAINVLGKSAARTGEGNGMSSLKSSDILQIRAWWKTGDVTMKALADKWCVSSRHIASLISGRRWGHVT